jgi:hypothetical protein
MALEAEGSVRSIGRQGLETVYFLEAWACIGDMRWILSLPFHELLLQPADLFLQLGNGEQVLLAFKAFAGVVPCE